MAWIQKPPMGTPLIPGHPQLDGLVGWWLFQEGSGDRVNDLSGNGNMGTLNNFVFPPTASSGWNPGKFGRALVFDGASDFMETADISMENAQTILAWIRKEDAGGTGIILGKGNGATTDQVLFGWVTSSRLRYYLNSTGGGTGYQLASYTWSPDTNFYHIGATWNGNDTMQIYVDGFPVGTTATIASVYNSANPVTLGRYGSFDGHYFDGFIDDVRIYNRCLTQSEIRDVMQRPFAAFATMDIAMLAQLANLMAMERSISRRVHGRVFGRVN